MPLIDPADEPKVKSWLIGILKELCPADPELLADYVIALVRDADYSTVSGVLKEQLSEFLQDSVDNFVDRFITYLKSYQQKAQKAQQPITKQPPTTTPQQPSPIASSSATATNEKKRVKEEEEIRDTKKVKTSLTTSSTPSKDTSKSEPSDNKSKYSREIKDYDSERRRDDKRKDSRDNRDNRKDSRDSRERDSRDSYDKRDSRTSRETSKYSRDGKNQDKGTDKEYRKKITGDTIKDEYGNDIVVLNKDILTDPSVARLPSVNTIMLTGVPFESNRLHKMYHFFKRFGPIKNIMIKQHNGRAFIQFVNKEDAQQALQSPDAILDNRFIQSAWAKRTAAEMVLEHGSSEKEENPEQKTEVLKQTSEVSKKAEEILSKQLEMYKSLEQKLEQSEGEQKKQLAEMLKQLAKSIEETLAHQKNILGKAQEIGKTKLEQKLEFFKRKKEELKDQSLDEGLKQITEASPSLASSSSAGRGAPSLRGRGAALVSGRSLVKDNKSTTLYVTNIPESKRTQDDIRSHFSKFGNVENVEVLNDGACLVKYRFRSEGIKASKEGTVLDGNTLDFKWKEEPKPNTTDSSAATATPASTTSTTTTTTAQQ
ncbi:hypothetical protein C9374_005539 [Naegleria lovaniensis]|uniref:RRM domain-containing protein n=1 Tax=Naegleria lovaniensis TaxID=51637 RepID=A0AA88KIL3_NAELO|nr:uncharacterized protein C9374_005539 [Naegleria lovaniensis]KAG2382337.1 hypothetical protein C9374_005539 [Naegleria lovaniensis]